jgi:hypothetical protein
MAEALETAEQAITERTPVKRDLEDGEITTTSNPSPKKKAKKGDGKSSTPFFASCMDQDKVTTPKVAKSSMVKLIS